jgi:hypothetical protein
MVLDDFLIPVDELLSNIQVIKNYNAIFYYSFERYRDITKNYSASSTSSTSSTSNTMIISNPEEEKTPQNPTQGGGMRYRGGTQINTYNAKILFMNACNAIALYMNGIYSKEIKSKSIPVMSTLIQKIYGTPELYNYVVGLISDLHMNWYICTQSRGWNNDKTIVALYNLLNINQIPYESEHTIASFTLDDTTRHPYIAFVFILLTYVNDYLNGRIETSVICNLFGEELKLNTEISKYQSMSDISSIDGWTALGKFLSYFHTKIVTYLNIPLSATNAYVNSNVTIHPINAINAMRVNNSITAGGKRRRHKTLKRKWKRPVVNITIKKWRTKTHKRKSVLKRYRTYKKVNNLK